MDDTELDAVLAPPALSAPETLDRDLATLLRDVRRPRRAPRLIAAGVGVTLVLGGATAAAASMSGVWEPDMETAKSHIYTLPSGRQCEIRVTVEPSSPDDAEAAAQHIIDTVDLVEEAGGRLYLAGESASASEDYRSLSAMQSAVNGVVLDRLEQQGYSLSGMGVGSQSFCGMDFE